MTTKIDNTSNVTIDNDTGAVLPDTNLDTGTVLPDANPDIDMEAVNNYIAVHIDDIATEAFLEYAQTVIKRRALPDVRDGLKPVHRRIMYAQHVLGNTSNKPYKKSARIVGDVIGKYHPHGDSSVYDALVRLCQSFSLAAPLGDGQGNFGSRDGDSAAAMRYTEVRMTKIGEAMLQDLNLDTVDFVENYDGSEDMPEVFPTRCPNLLINGGEGIAVGMASKIPTHNPIEVMNCVIAMTKAKMEGATCSLGQLIELMPSPDFPTGGLIHGLENYTEAWKSGRARFKIRSVWREELIAGRRTIVITELPYSLNKGKLIQHIDMLRRDRDELPPEIQGIFRVDDESSFEDGIRVAVQLKHGYDPEIVFNELCKKSKVESDYGYDITVIKDGKPATIGIFEALDTFIEFREEIITRRTKKLLDMKSKRMHTLNGLIKAISRLDATIETIRAASNTSQANVALQDLLGVDESQATDILGMKLQSLASTQLSDIQLEHEKNKLEIDELNSILVDKIKQFEIIIAESEDEIIRFANFKDTQTKKLIFSQRRSQHQIELINIRKEDLVPREDCSICMSKDGFIRRIPSSDIEIQRRGTKGKSLMDIANKDFVQQTTMCNSHDTLAFITDKGLISFIRVFDVDTATRGVHINNLLKLSSDENILLFRTISEDELLNSNELNVVIGTDKGFVKRTRLDRYSPTRRVSVRTISDRHLDDEKIIFFGIGADDAEICLVSSSSKMIRSKVNEIRERSRSAGGVKVMVLSSDERIRCGAIVANNQIESSNIGCVTKSGILKVSKLTDYRIQKRNGKGLIAMNVQDGDSVLSAFVFNENEGGDVVTTTKKGVVNRVNLEQFRVTQRRTQGVRLIKLDSKKDELVSAFVANSESEPEVD